jgi:hypothetical protein
MAHPMHFRFLAGLLAAGGLFCSLFSIAASRISKDFLIYLVFVPGYIITVGYVIRCVYTPQLSWRRVIWGASVFVQGAWLFFYLGVYLYMSLKGENNVASLQDKICDVINPMTFWWVFALSISIYGLRFDNKQAL